MLKTKVQTVSDSKITQKGLANSSLVALNTETPAAMVNDSGILKRKVLEPDEFPRVDLSITNPLNPFASMNPANHDRAAVGRGGSDRGKRRSYPMSDGRSITAGDNLN